ncbi:MAG: serine hydrolase [Elusimicrobiota bacterium]|jgi:CubicO group peptidase (beta-lactamase class C family)|nr:serine hydrolase [Elusimicrobiota bacterium]
MKKSYLLVSLLFVIFSNTFSYAQTKPETFSPDISSIITEFDAYAANAQKQWNVPGISVAIVIDDQIVYKKSFGVTNVYQKIPVNNQTVFQIGSCAKSFTALLTAMLVDKNIFDWEDKVQKYLPNFQLFDETESSSITIEDLLSQNSGLPPYSQHLMLLFGYNRDFIINSMRYIKPIGKLGERYSYQNNLYLVLGRVIEKATGRSWNKNIKEMIFTPLEMPNTSTYYETFRNTKNKSSSHFYKNSVLETIPENVPYSRWPYEFAPAGGINSNIDDMSQWLLFLVNKNRLKISEINFEKLFEKKTYTGKNNSVNNYYCLGWRCEENPTDDIYWHAGATDGQGAYISIRRKEKIGIVVLMNLPNGKMAEALSKKFYDLYLGNIPTDWSVVKLRETNTSQKNKQKKQTKKTTKLAPFLNLEKYVGIYQNSLYGEAEVRIKDEQLQFSTGNREFWITLKHYNANSFSAVAVAGWNFKNPMFIFNVLNDEVQGVLVEKMTDGVEPGFKKIK